MKEIFVALFVLFFVMAGSHVQGQQFEVQERLAKDAVAAKDWKKAHALLTKIVKVYDGRASVLFGPKFGWFWYQKGVCEMELKQWEEAIASFRHCYKKYVNIPKSESVNVHRLDALGKWADAAQKTGQRETATKLRAEYRAEVFKQDQENNEKKQ